MCRICSNEPTPKNVRFDEHSTKMIYFKLVLKRLGISNKYIGHYYLLEILDVLINGEIVVRSFEQDVYPYISEKMQVNKCTIERNIRNLIDKCWSCDMMKKLGVFYVEGKKPSCRKFVFIVKRHIENLLA